MRARRGSAATLILPLLTLAVFGGGCGDAPGAASSTSSPSATVAAPPPVALTPAPSAPTTEDQVARLKPPITVRLIPFGPARRAEMRAYSERHYGHATAALRAPHVIVLHYTVTDTFAATFATFANDVADPELHELPGTCAHFVIGREGKIYQLVRLNLRCRHTVGLNWTAIGIEHVGNSDADVLDRPVVRRASLRLVRWLRCRYGIARSDVIGHAESLSSPYHRERVARLRTQTHADMQGPAMARYRALLKGCPSAPTITTGPAPSAGPAG